jgi:hypothetical protein
MDRSHTGQKMTNLMLQNGGDQVTISQQIRLSLAFVRIGENLQGYPPHRPQSRFLCK